MGNAINDLGGKTTIAPMNDTPAAVPAKAAGDSVKSLYGTATEELKTMLNRLNQLAATAQALVRSRNSDLQ